MEVMNSLNVNKSKEEYTVHGIESTGGPWARNTTVPEALTPPEWQQDGWLKSALHSLFLGGVCREECSSGGYVLTCNATGPAACLVKDGTSPSYKPTCSAAGNKAACDQLSQTCAWGEFTPGDVTYYNTAIKSYTTYHCASLGQRFCSGGEAVAHGCTDPSEVPFASAVTGVCQRLPSMTSAEGDRLGEPCYYEYGTNQPAYKAEKGSDWSLWNETLLANSIAISSPDHPARRFGPSQSSPLGEEFLPSGTMVRWDERFGYRDGKTFRDEPWKICF